MRMNVFEMEGFLRGKCVPRDLKVNETNAEYLVRKFAEAEAKISALYEDHQKAIESIKQADAAVKLAHEKFSALAAENAKLKKFCKDAAFDADYEAELGMERGGFSDALNEIKTPATDAFLAEGKTEARKEGAYFVANRMLAAWKAGFIDDTAKNAADIARMILTSTEFMTNAPESHFDRSFSDGVLEDIAEQLRKGGSPMSNIDKQALREIAAAAVGAHERLSVMPPDDIFDISLAEGPQLDADITALNALNSAANPTTVLAMLDELEAAEKRIAELEGGAFNPAILDVVAERQRQQSVEGWTPEHDNAYQNSELADAAACYAIHAHNQGFSTPAHWPWSPDWWKQSGARRDLVKAGALILAEIERIDRAAGIGVKGE